MANTPSLTGKLVTDGLPVLISAFIFILLAVTLGPNPHNLLKAAYIAVIVVGLWNLLIRRGKPRFSQRLFNCMTAFGVAIGLATSTSAAVIQGFNAKVSSGHFVPDMILGNLLYAPWSKYLAILLTYLVIYGVYQAAQRSLNRS